MGGDDFLYQQPILEQPAPTLRYTGIEIDSKHDGINEPTE